MIHDAKFKLDKIDQSFFKRKIYLQRTTSNKIQEIIDNFYDILRDTHMYTIGSEHQTKAQKLEEVKKRKMIEKYLNKDLPKVLQELEKHFRNLMKK